MTASGARDASTTGFGMCAGTGGGVGTGVGTVDVAI